MRTTNLLFNYYKYKVWAFSLLLVVTGCDIGNGLMKSTSDAADGLTDLDKLPIEVKYAEAYDEESITFSRLWPEDMAASPHKSTADGDAELMVDYEKIRKTIAFDEDGYMTCITEFIEGDPLMNMPEAVYNELKADMPARSHDYDPVVKVVDAGGISKHYTKSGKLKYETTYDPEFFRIDPALLHQAVHTSLPGQANEQVQHHTALLTRQGIAYTRLGEFFAVYEQQEEPQAGTPPGGALTYTLTVDLRHGQPVRTDILKANGDYEAVVLNTYRQVEGRPMMDTELWYEFGEVNGQWGVTRRVQTRRTNMNIIKN